MFGGVYFGFIPYAGWYLGSEEIEPPVPVDTTEPLMMQTEQWSDINLTTVENLANADAHVILNIKD